MLKLFAIKANFQPQFIVNLLLVTYIAPLKVLLPYVYKCGMIYTLAYRCFCICSDGTKFHGELTFLKRISHKNSYPENLIDKCFKTFLDDIYHLKEKAPTVERNRLLLVLRYLEAMSLQTRTKLHQAFKGVLHCRKQEIALEMSNQAFQILSDLKSLYPKILCLKLVINFSVVSAVSPIMVRVSDT